MRICFLVSAAAALVAQASMVNPTRDYDRFHYFALEMAPEQIERVGELLPHLEYQHPARGLEELYHVYALDKLHPDGEMLGNLNSNNYRLMRRDANPLHDALVAAGIPSVHLLLPKVLEKRAPVPVVYADDPPVDSSLLVVEEAKKRLGIDDPLFAKQWHLINAAFPGNDLNVTGAWYQNITGNGVVAAVVDDGLDYESKDLATQFCRNGLWDFNDKGNMPKPRLSDDNHGTRCAGEIAAQLGNGYCGVGVAYNAKVSGIRILLGQISSEDEAALLVYAMDVNDIYSCSWGPRDNGATMEAPDALIKAAMKKGVTEGRRGLGLVYVFALGNGARSGDNCNFDGYTNLIYSITVGAIDHKGLHPPYSESCSAVLVVTYSSGSGEHVETTDINGKCSERHGGTLAAAPMAAGVYALVLEANPSLTWRDMQYLTVMLLEIVNQHDGQWQQGASGKMYSHKYGYGKLNAGLIVDMAKLWTNVGPQQHLGLGAVAVNKEVGTTTQKRVDEDPVVVSTLEVTKEDVERAKLKRMEHLTVTVNIDAQRRGDVLVTLKLPTGVESWLGVYRMADLDGGGYPNWKFMLVAHWGESGVGTWTLEVRKRKENMGNKVVFKDWQMTLFGERAEEEVASSSLSAVLLLSTVLLSPVLLLSTSAVVAGPSSASAVPSAASSTSATASASLVEEGEEGQHRHEVSTRRWTVYFLFLLAGGTCAVVVIHMLSRNRTLRRRRPREDFEFDLISNDDDDYSEASLLDLDLGDAHNFPAHAVDEEFEILDDEMRGEEDQMLSEPSTGPSTGPSSPPRRDAL